jgi:hypothetical protein
MVVMGGAAVILYGMLLLHLMGDHAGRGRHRARTESATERTDTGRVDPPVQRDFR